MASECTVSARNLATQARALIQGQGLRTPQIARVNAAGGGDRDPSGGRTSGGKDFENGEFCGACWSCGGHHRSDSCKLRWQQQLARAAFRLAKLGESDQAILSTTRQGLEKAGRRGTPGKAAVAVVAVVEAVPQPRPKRAKAKDKAATKAKAELKAAREAAEWKAAREAFGIAFQRGFNSDSDEEEKEKKEQEEEEQKQAEVDRDNARQEEKEKEEREEEEEREAKAEMSKKKAREKRAKAEQSKARKEDKKKVEAEKAAAAKAKGVIGMREIEERIGVKHEMLMERVLQLEKMIVCKEVSVVTEDREKSIVIQQEEESRRAAVELDRIQALELDRIQALEFKRFQQEEESRRAAEAAAALASAWRPERRLAEDGGWYTLAEFEMFFGITHGMYWNQAHAAGVRDG